jgi:uncharacterized protein (DUF4213/DUF364 family)
MKLVDGFHAAAAEAAADTTIEAMTIGLGYTAVVTATGCVGLSYSMVERTASCTHVRAFRDFDGAPAIELLEYVRSDDTLERAMGLALVNALNQPRARQLPDDAGPAGTFVGAFGVREGTRVAMVGFFPPVARRLREIGAELRVLDRDKRMGDETAFLSDLADWPDVLIVTATAILNDSLESVLDHVTQRVKVVVLGPTTPLVPEAYGTLPVHLLAGLVPVDNERVVAAVRQGAGTPALTPHCRKVSWVHPDIAMASEDADTGRGSRA